jgi:hypothetical protein
MKNVIGMVFLILTGAQLAVAQNGSSAQRREVRVANFCDMTKRPDRYDGKTVQVRATYASNSEKAIFFDDGCKRSESQPDVLASAKFIGSREEVERSLNQIEKALNNKFGATHVASVTMVAVFRDNYSTKNSSVCLNCPRYVLEVKRVLAAE